MQHPFLSRGAAFVLALTATSLLGPGGQATEITRPSLSDACRAWREHISELLDQHRLVQEIDDSTWHVMNLQYASARDTCSIGDYTAGLRLYEAIPLGRVQGASLR